MKKSAAQVLLLLLVIAAAITAVFLVRQVLHLPFGPTNDKLHQRGSAVTLDRFIPAGTYITPAMTIQDVVSIRFRQETAALDGAMHSLSDLIPLRYRLLANLLQFAFWTFLWMTFLRVFTFLGYARALRVSLLMGAILYFFMPDVSPGKRDDTLFLAIAILIIAIRAYRHWKTRHPLR